MENLLLKEFAKIGAKQWKNALQYQLNGADYAQTLLEQTSFKTKIKPFYHPDTDAFYLPNQQSKIEFHLSETIYVYNFDLSLLRAQRTLKKSFDSLEFVLPSKDESIFELLKKLVGLKQVFIRVTFIDLEFFCAIENFSKTQDYKIYLLLDPIGKLCQTGNYFQNLAVDFQNLEKINLNFKTVSWLTIQSQIYNEAGASTVQEIAYTLAHLNQYLYRFSEMNSDVVIEVSIGKDFYTEIAKIKALRLLANLLLSEYNKKNQLIIKAKPSLRNKTFFNSQLNNYRVISELLSGILANADIIETQSMDVFYKKANSKSAKVVRKNLRKFHRELNQEPNPSNGAYFIEHLTQQVAQQSLELFKDIEKNGGFLTQLHQGTIQRKIKETAQEEEENYLKGLENEFSLKGRAYFVFPEVLPKEAIYPFVKYKSRKTLIQPIISKRLSENFEKKLLSKIKNESQKNI